MHIQCGTVIEATSRINCLTRVQARVGRLRRIDTQKRRAHADLGRCHAQVFADAVAVEQPVNLQWQIAACHMTGQLNAVAKVGIAVKGERIDVG